MAVKLVDDPDCCCYEVGHSCVAACDGCTPPTLSVDFSEITEGILTSCDDVDIGGKLSRKLVSYSLSNVVLEQCGSVGDAACRYVYSGGGNSVVRVYESDNCAGGFDQYTLDQMTTAILEDDTVPNGVNIYLGVGFVSEDHTDPALKWHMTNFEISGTPDYVEGCSEIDVTMKAGIKAKPYTGDCNGTQTSTKPNGWVLNYTEGGGVKITGPRCE